MSLTHVSFSEKRSLKLLRRHWLSQQESLNQFDLRIPHSFQLLFRFDPFLAYSSSCTMAELQDRLQERIAFASFFSRKELTGDLNGLEWMAF